MAAEQGTAVTHDGGGFKPSAEQSRNPSDSSRSGRPQRKAVPSDATGINPEKRKPIHPKSVFISPA